MTNIILWDIETGPLPEEQLKHSMPEFKAPSNYKDPEKIAANIKEQEDAFIEKAALSPMTGQIVSIAYQIAGGPKTFKSYGHELTEQGLLADFMEVYKSCSGGAYGKIAGWNIKSFDLPFIVRRCWALGIKVPHSLMPQGTVRFYWPPCFIDLREIWGCGEYGQHISGSLDAVGACFGLGRKQGHGGDFAKLYADPETRERAVQYQESEMLICDGLCKRFGLVEVSAAAEEAEVEFA
jgi:3'-5' exonuclease